MKVRILLLLASAVLLAACESSPVVSERPEGTSAVAAVYKIGVGDQLSVGVWKNPELSVNVPVRPDGKISVPLVGDIVAAGHSAEDLALAVENSLQNYVRSPQVTVIVTNAASAEFLRRIRVTGAVNAPQSIAHQQGVTVLDVILQAGGLTPFASPNSAKLYRKTDEGMKIYPVLLKDILERGRLDTNYTLVPSDIITVPERAF